MQQATRGDGKHLPNDKQIEGRRCHDNGWNNLPSLLYKESGNYK